MNGRGAGAGLGVVGRGRRMWNRIVEAFNANWENYTWFRVCVIGGGAGIALAIVQKILFGSVWGLVKTRFRAPDTIRRRREVSAGEKHLKAGEHEPAAEAFIRAEEFDRAIAAYAQGKLWLRAAELASARGKKLDAAGFYVRAGQEEKAALLYSELQDFAQAEAAFQKAGKPLLIGQMYERAQRWKQAGDWYLKGGFMPKAAEAYAKGGLAADAAPLFEKLWLQGGGGGARITSEREQTELRKLAERAAQFYAAGQKPAKAVELYERAGRLAEAADVAEKGGDAGRAGDLYRRAGDFDRARACYAKAGNARQAALLEGEQLQRAGRPLEAAACFEAHGELQRAAELYGADPAGAAKAAGVYERLGQATEAAHWYCKAGDLRKGAELYEAAQEYGLAERIFHQLGDADALLRLALRRENYFLAGQAQAQRGAYDEAIRHLQKVGRNHDDYRKACAELARAFRAKGAPAQANIKFEEYARLEPLDHANVAVYYDFARCLEEQGSAARAIEIYHQILAHDIGYGDAEARVEALQKKSAV